MSPHSNLAEHLIETLNAICGAYRRAGDKISNVTYFPPGGECVESVRPPNRTWEQEPKLFSTDSGIVGSEFPTSRLPDEILHGGVRALISVGNLATALGQPEKTRAALNALDLLVTIDPRMTATGQLSDYVLPTKLPYERYDVTQSALFLDNYAQLAKPVMEAPPGVLEDWEIFWGLAHRMNKPLTLMAYRWGGTSSSTPDIEIDMETKPTSEALMRAVCAPGRIPMDDLFEHPEGVSMAFEPITIKPAKQDDGARLQVCPPDVAEELRAVRREAAPTGDFPYRLIVRRMLETMNSAFRDGGTTLQRWPQTPAFMNPVDVEALGFAEGDVVEIVSEAGAVTASVQPDSTMRPGVISMPHQWGGQVYRRPHQRTRLAGSQPDQHQLHAPTVGDSRSPGARRRALRRLARIDLAYLGSNVPGPGFWRLIMWISPCAPRPVFDQRTRANSAQSVLPTGAQVTCLRTPHASALSHHRAGPFSSRACRRCWPRSDGGSPSRPPWS